MDKITKKNCTVRTRCSAASKTTFNLIQLETNTGFRNSVLSVKEKKGLELMDKITKKRNFTVPVYST